MHLHHEKFMELFEYVPRLAVDGVLIKDGKVLLMKRAGEPFRGMWGIPGGFVEKGERVEEAALREVKEETGIETKVLRLVGVYSDPDRDPRGHVITVAFLLEQTGGELKGNEETQDVRFFEKDDIPEQLAADHTKIIEDAFKILSEEQKKE